jgi:hypothetical protein
MPTQSNPYQPSQSVGHELDNVASEVSFVLTRGVLRHATDHYLLHYIPKRLAFGSILLIFLSGWAIFKSVQYGPLATMAAATVALFISAGIYLMLAHQAKMRVRQKQTQLGFEQNSAISVSVDDDSFLVVTSNGEHRWPRSQARLLRTHSGLLISPEPLVAIFVPKNNQSPPEAFKTLRHKLTLANRNDKSDTA